MTGQIFSFLRSSGGTFTTYAVQGALGTDGGCINTGGTIGGTFSVTNAGNSDFLRASDGTITTFDVSAAGTGSEQGTLLEANDEAGDIVGFYRDASNVFHGFVRTP